MPRPPRPLDRTPVQKPSTSVSPAARRRTSSGRSGESFARISDFFRLPRGHQSTVGDRLAQTRPSGKILILGHEHAEADLRSACQMRGDGVGASARKGCQSITIPNAHPNRAGRARFALTLPATNYASPAGPCRGRGTLAARVARLHASPIIPSAFLVCPIHRVVRAGRFEQDGFILLVANKLKDDAEIVAGGARPRTRRLALGLWARRGG